MPIRRSRDACRKHGKALGMGGVNDDENARRYIAMGSRFITSGNDHSFMVSGSIERATFYRDLRRRPAVLA